MDAQLVHVLRGFASFGLAWLGPTKFIVTVKYYSHQESKSKARNTIHLKLT